MAKATRPPRLLQMILPMSPITKAIKDLMADRLNQEDTLITYDELEKLAGKPLWAIRNFVYTARNRILDDYHKWLQLRPCVALRPWGGQQAARQRKWISPQS